MQSILRLYTGREEGVGDLILEALRRVELLFGYWMRVVGGVEGSYSWVFIWRDPTNLIKSSIIKQV